MHDIGAAVVGAGFIGPVHVEALRRLGVPVRGILGRDDRESESACRAMGLPRAYRSLDEVLADPSVQAVHLAVPNVLHYTFARKVLEAGRHVICEKPLAMDSTQSAELVALAGASGLHTAVCYNLRFYPLNLEVRDRIRAGEVGAVYSITGNYSQDWLFHDTDYNWRVLAGEGGALRAIGDIGTHWMDLVQSMTGLHVEQVFADLATIHPVRRRPKGEVETFTSKLRQDRELEEVAIDTEDMGCLLFRFQGGARGMVLVSQVAAGRKNCLRYEIAGSKCAVAWESEEPNSLWVGYRDRPNEVLVRDPALLGGLARGFASYPGGHAEGFPDTFKQCFRAFYQAIAEETPATEVLYPTFADGHREVVLCEAILKSHQEQRWVTLEG
jgi:predicted dehydrogenase